MVTIIGQLLTPIFLCLALMLAAAVSFKRPRFCKFCLWSAIAVLLLGGNRWVARWISTPLEWQVQAPNPIPQADAIVVLGGAIEPKEWPRRTVEISDAGDRILYGFELFRQGKARLILCSGGQGERGVREFSEAEDMRTMLQSLGAPANAILVETTSLNTRENAANSRPLIKAAGIKRLLLVTSAVHMPRSLEAFKRELPDVEIIPAPTDYAFTRLSELNFKTAIEGFIPSGKHISELEATLHEYIGLLYYRLIRR